MTIGHNSKRITNHDELLEAMAASCETYADAVAEVAKLDNRKKVILAQNKPDKGTVAAKEDAAYLSEGYQEFVAQITAAEREKAFWQARRDYFKAEFENHRTERADIRAVTKGV